MLKNTVLGSTGPLKWGCARSIFDLGFNWGCHKIKITFTHHHFDKIQSTKFKRTNTLLTTIAASYMRLYLVDTVDNYYSSCHFRPYIQTLTKFLITLVISKFFRNFMFMDLVANSVIQVLSITYCYIFLFLCIAELCS